MLTAAVDLVAPCGPSVMPVSSFSPTKATLTATHHGLIAGGGSLSYDLAGLPPRSDRVRS